MSKIDYHLSVKMGKEHKEMLEMICKMEKRPKSWVVREVLVEWMERYLKDKGKG